VSKGASFNDAEVLEHLLSGGEVLPEQLPGSSLWSPEKRLAAAVLASALVSIRDHDDHRTRGARGSEMATDLAWIRSNDVQAPFCFLRLCDVFDLDPDWVRENVERWRRTERSARVPFSLSRHAA
jgi:hypothetical protein